MTVSRTVFALVALPLLALASPPPPTPTLVYRPSPDDERPMPVSVVLGPQDGSLALELVFDRVPWGDDCKMRCANTTLFLDLDSNKNTGLQLGKAAAETGSDLAITLLGVREYRELSADTRFRATLRQFQRSATKVEDGQVFSELDLRRDESRFRNEGKVVHLLVDVAQVDLPHGKKIRAVFHPAGGDPVQGEGPGMLAPISKHPIFPKR